MTTNREGRRFESCRARSVCSNRAATQTNNLKTQEKHHTGEFDSLQGFCKSCKPTANYRAAFTRQRSLVRTQHRPLRKAAAKRRAAGRKPARTLSNYLGTRRRIKPLTGLATTRHYIKQRSG